MRGVILGIEDGRGVLSADDHRRLEFPMSEWRSATPPVSGDIVDFVDEAGEARAVYRVAATVSSSPVIEGGATMLGAISVGCLALGFIIPFVPTIAALILGLLGAGQAQLQRDDTGLLLSRIGWIGAAVMLALGVLLILVFGAFLAQMFAAWAAMTGLHWTAHGGSV
jgi:hypothetical protein